MSELPGMWDESDLRGGEADSAEDRLRAQNAVLKARIAELERAAKYLRTCQKAYVAARGGGGMGGDMGGSITARRSAGPRQEAPADDQ